MRGRAKRVARPGRTWLPVLGLLGLAIAIPWDATPVFARPVTTATAEYGAERALLPVPEPDLSRLEAAVQKRLRGARADFAAFTKRAGQTDAALGDTYGDLGRLYHAHHLFDPAEACYRNAQTLMPEDFRWPYLLGYVYQATGRLELAMTSYQRALEHPPDYAPVQLRLAQVYIDLTQPDRAEPLLQKALTAQGLEGAAAFGLGRAALTRQEYKKAAAWFEQALEACPEASRIHYPLAMAYRGLGDIERARQHLGLHGPREAKISDPLVDEVNQLLSGARTHLYRAIKAAQAEQYDLAAEEFRETLVLDPDNVPARVRLARTLHILGDPDGTYEQLRETLERAPKHAPAHYFMGLLLEERESDEAAVTHYRATLAADPEHAGAHYQMANALMRARKYAEAARHYAKVIEYIPQDLPARLMQAMALAGTGVRHQEARDRLAEALAAYPGDPVFAQALARLLAASPVEGVRDGSRALALAKELYNHFNAPEAAETLAMAYAELGRFDDAVSIQQNAIAVAMFSGRLDLLPRLNNNLDLYRSDKPCRTPWAPNDPIFQPPRGDSLGT